MRVRMLLSSITLGCSFSASASLDDLPQFRVPDCLGVNIHFIEPREKELDMIEEAGFGMIRMDLSWSHVEKREGEYDFGGYQRLTEALRKRGIVPLYILDYSNRLYEENRSVVTREGRKAFARFAAEAVKALGPDPIIWEIWNEPNLKHFWQDQPSFNDYVLLVEEAAKAMWNVDPDCTIVAPATSRIPFDFLEACFDRGLLNWVDAVTVHPYRTKNPETALNEYISLKRLLNRYSVAKSIPVLSGEWGYSIHPYRDLTVDEHLQAQFLVRQFLTNFMAGVRLSIWYDWHDDGPDPDEREHNFGIVKYNFQHKEAYKAATVFDHQLKGMKFIERIPTSNEEDFLVLFGNQKRRVLVAWTTGETHQLPLKQLRVETAAVSMLGEKISLQKEGDKVIITVSQDPVYISLVDW